jgi:hypothetical protein
VATAQVDSTGLIQTALVGFSLKAKSSLTQVLFVKFSSSSTKLQYAAGKATIYEAALAAQREQVAGRLADYRRQMVGEVKLPPLPAPRGARAMRRRAVAVQPAKVVRFRPGKALKAL